MNIESPRRRLRPRLNAGGRAGRTLIDRYRRARDRGILDNITSSVLILIAIAAWRFLLHTHVPTGLLVLVIALAAIVYVTMRRRLTTVKDDLQRARVDATVVREARQGHATLLGIDVGRSKISYGLIQVGPTGRPAFPEPNELTAIEDGAMHWDPQKDDLYSTLVALINRSSLWVEAHLTDTTIDGIGVALPGQIRPAHKDVAHSDLFRRSNEPFVDVLAARMASDEVLCRRILRVSPDGALENPDRRHQTLASIVAVDNDARCATRYLQAARRREQGWTNFACIVIGTGAGAGLVLDSALYYGSSMTAGELGHTVVDTDRSIVTYIDRTSGLPMTYEPAACSCDSAGGVHWESLVAGRGFVDLARHL